MADKESLLKRRRELRERLDAIGRDLRSGLERDMEDQAQQLENRDVLLEIERVTSEELAGVERALQELSKD